MHMATICYSGHLVEVPAIARRSCYLILCSEAQPTARVVIGYSDMTSYGVYMVTLGNMRLHDASPTLLQ